MGILLTASMHITRPRSYACLLRLLPKSCCVFLPPRAQPTWPSQLNAEDATIAATSEQRASASSR